ncbi:MAG: AAA family ATPase [Caldilineaceae bacterium]
MSDILVDTQTVFSPEAYTQLPAQRSDIEDPEQDPVPAEKPPCKTVERENYLPDPKLVEAVNLTIALGRPLLLQGDPGCGKTRLAYAVAYALGLPLEISYIKSTSRAQDLLYTYDAVNRLYDAQAASFHRDGPDPKSPADIRQYIRLGPLGRAIVRAQYGRRSVVLIDEIDKADLDFPNDLLWELDRREFRVAEAPAMHFAVDKDPVLRPIVFITHNEEKPLPVAFLRRCIFHFIQFPTSETQLQQILASHKVENPQLRQQTVKVLLALRKLDLTKKPGLSELLDWVGYLDAVQYPVERLPELPFLGVLLKQQIDQQRVSEEWRGQIMEAMQPA